jgi:hypothetical protein
MCAYGRDQSEGERMGALNDLLNPILNNPAVKLAEQLTTLFLIVLYLAVIFWTYRDANHRGAMGWFWGIVVAIFPFVGWVIYLVVRPSETLGDMHERDLEMRAREAELAQHEYCPACFKPVEKDFLICPYCQKKLRKGCSECGKALKLNWTVCPYCKTKQA